MKITNIWKSLLGICFLTGVMSCQKEELPYYDDIAGIYFNGMYWSYSFMESPDKSVDTLNLPTLISGMHKDYDRTFRVKLYPKYTTAPAELYEVLDGTVKAGSYDGILPIVVRKADILEDTVFKIAIGLTETEDFPELNLGQNIYLVEFTAKIIRPANWGLLRYYFGEYSTRWWKKIMEWTGRNSIPYNPDHPDKETWWMNVDDVKAFKTLVTRKLQEYNGDHPGEPLTHDDGLQAGLPVTMP